MTNAWNAVAKNRNRKVFIILTQKEEGGVDRIRGAFRT